MVKGIAVAVDVALGTAVGVGRGVEDGIGVAVGLGSGVEVGRGANVGNGVGTRVAVAVGVGSVVGAGPGAPDEAAEARVTDPLPWNPSVAVTPLYLLMPYPAPRSVEMVLPTVDPPCM